MAALKKIVNDLDVKFKTCLCQAPGSELDEGMLTPALYCHQSPSAPGPAVIQNYQWP
jgi:hypothetical protein